MKKSKDLKYKKEKRVQIYLPPKVKRMLVNAAGLNDRSLSSEASRRIVKTFTDDEYV